MENKKRTLREDARLIARGIGIWRTILPGYAAYLIPACLVSCALPYFPLYLSAELVNELSGGRDMRRLLILAAVTVTGTFLLSVLSRFLSGRLEASRRMFGVRHEAYLFDAENTFQYEHLEDPDVALMRSRILTNMNTSYSGLMVLLMVAENSFRNILELIVSASLTLSLFRRAQGDYTGFFAFVNSPWIVPVLIAFLAADAVVSFQASVRANNKYQDIVSELAKQNRMGRAYRNAKGVDMQIFKLNEVAIADYKKWKIRPEWVARNEKADLAYTLESKPTKLLLQIVLFWFTAAKAFLGVIGIGNFILYQGTLQRFLNAVSALVFNFGRLRYNNQYVEEVFRYLDLPNAMYKGSLAVEKRDDIEYEIEFRDVSFQYPRSTEWVLRHVNLKFQIGKNLAIVGENGSGKTTLMKLLCRLYDPTEGKILLNGIDITRYRYDEYMGLFSVVFQDYALFAFSVARNVAVSDPVDERHVWDCLNRVGIGDKIAGLDQGIHTSIGRDYENDSVDFSGGEQQKIALARALYKDAPFMILDEPTAALDPIAEAEIYARFHETVKDKTSVFISHRLSSCKFCDEIAVFDQGQLVQKGSHDTLLADENGKYYELWNAQAQYYVK